MSKGLRELLLLVGVLVAGVVGCGDDGESRSELPKATLQVATDGCGVIRSGPTPEPKGLQWSVKDAEGFEVLGRNALSETRYRYYRPGNYMVVLKAWDGTRYVDISNTVDIACSAPRLPER